MSDSRRYRHRRPSYYDEESEISSIDSYPDPGPRRGNRRPPPPGEDVRGPGPSPLGQGQRRRSILVDPDADSDLRQRRRRNRSTSGVRIQASDEDDYDAPRTRRGRGSRSHDLESKDTDANRIFRAKRGGYESDEAEMFRKIMRGHALPDEAPNGSRNAPPHAGEQTLPMRGKTRAPLPDLAGAAGAGAVGGASAAAALGGGAPPPAPEAGLRRRRTYREPKPRDMRDDDDYDAGPPSRRPQRPRPVSAYDDPGYRSDVGRRAPRQRQARPRGDYADDYDHPPRRRTEPEPDYDYEARPRRGDEDHRAARPRRAQPDPQDYYSDYREDRAPRRDPRRGSRREDPYDDEDMRARPMPSASRKGPQLKGWQKEAGAAFMTYAFPVIRREGTKYFKKEMGKYMAKRDGRY